jgi:hypothetical protein
MEFSQQIDYVMYMYYGYKSKSKFLCEEEYLFALNSYIHYQFQNGFLTMESYPRFKSKLDHLSRLLIKMEEDLKESESIQIAADALLTLSK